MSDLSVYVISNLTTCECTLQKSVSSNLAGYESEGGKEMGLGDLETKYRFEMNSLL